MENILTEELLKQLRLIKYNRGMTLLEQNEIPTVKSDRLGNTGDFSATPKIFNDDEYRKYENLSPEEKQKLESDYLNKEWKSRLCTKTAQQKRSVFNGEYYVSHEDFCKSFGGTQVYKSGDGDGVLGQGYFCGCKYNGDVLINNKTQKVNNYLNRPYTESTYVISDFLNDEHNILMVASIAFAMFGGGLGNVLSLITDGIDVGLYVEEGDYFMAGLATMFALIPMGDLLKAYLKKYPGAKKFTEKTLITILEKLKIKRPLSVDEKKILEAITSAEMANKAFWKLNKAKLKDVVFKNDPFYVVRFIVFLVEKGFIASKFLLKWGLIIGGVFWSWYKIAEWLGIKPKTEGGLTKPPSKSDLIESIVLSHIINMEETGYVWSTKNSKSNLPQVAAIQYALYAGNYFTPVETPTYKVINGVLKFSTSKDVKNVKIYSTTGKLIDDINNDGSNNFNSSKKLNKGIYILKVTNKKNEVTTSKLNYAGDDYSIYSVGSVKPLNKVKWGYYDEYTKNAVENYQEKNSLDVDGTVGKNTLKSLMSDIKNNDITDFLKPNNISNYDFKKVFEPEVELNREDFENAYLQQRQETLDSLNNVIKQDIGTERSGDSLKNVWKEWNSIEIPNYPKEIK